MSAATSTLHLVTVGELRHLGAAPSIARSIVRNRQHRALVSATLNLAAQNPDDWRLAEFAEVLLLSSARSRTFFCRHTLSTKRAGGEA